MSIDVFYKYLGLKGDGTVRANFLTNALFRFTQPNQLNDPFEVRPRVLMGVYAEEDVELAREEALKAGFPADQIEKFRSLFLETLPRRRFTPEEFPGIPYPKRTGSEERFRSMEELDAYKAEQEVETLFKHVNETYGFFCLTTSRDNLRMWSHYADSHRGIVVGFDAQHPFFSAAHDFYKVEYSEERISLSSNEGYLRLVGRHYSPGSDYKDLPTRLFLRKHPDWQSEQEWRMIRRLKECDYHSPDNPLVYLFTIPREAITVLILGAQISDRNKEEIQRQISSSSDWAHVQILQASLSVRKFSLDFL
jgi:hypothetical protein